MALCFLPCSVVHAAKKAASSFVTHAAKKASSCFVVRAARKASKEFGGDDGKRPKAKRLMIADENRGGLPNAKKSDDNQPLESMPVVAHVDPSSSSSSSTAAARKKQSADELKWTASAVSDRTVRRHGLGNYGRGLVTPTSSSSDSSSYGGFSSSCDAESYYSVGVKPVRSDHIRSNPEIPPEKKKAGSIRSRLRDLFELENCGGLPNAKKSDDLGDGMRAPGLVARLMGLESMPVVAHEKPRKALDSDRKNAGGRGGSGFPRLDQDLCPEMGKLESRPQKLQKTGGFLERRPTSAGRPGSDGFNKSVLSSRSRKQHHKLALPVKSPSLLQRDHKARMVKAATRILEPGLQSSNRAKCAVTSTGSSHADIEEGSDGSLSLKRSQTLLNGSLVGSGSSCGGRVEVSELRLREKKPLERKKHIQNDQDTCKPQQDGMPRPTPKKNKKNNLRQCQLRSNKDKVDPGPKMCGRRHSRGDPNELNESKDFVALNKNLRTRSTFEKSRSCGSKLINRKMTMQSSDMSINRNSVKVHAAKKASKKFSGSDGKRPMAKQLLIADENCEKFFDDVIVKEMSHSTGKWMAPEIDTFEIGMEIERNILEALVDEMVIDLCGC